MVNRIWQHHFGRGIVRSPNNFGYLGDRPTHPELLDWLASEFIKHGWHIKPLHRLIMLSSAYRMSSRAEPEVATRSHIKDPGNDLFWRFNMRRLSARLRDSIHAVTGRLNRQMYGPSYYPKLSAEVMSTNRRRERVGAIRLRRSRPAAVFTSTSSGRSSRRSWPISIFPTPTRAARRSLPRPNQPRRWEC